MTTESSQHKIDRAKGAEPTQVLDATARKKYIRSIQRRQQDGNQAVSQTNLSATTDVYNAKQYSAFRNLVSQVMLSAIPEVGVVVPTRNEQENIRPLVASFSGVSVVVPTRNEQENIRPLVASLRDALRGLHVEVIFVDDSDDDTSGVIEDAAGTMNSSLFRIELEHRVAGGARAGGLATAVVQGLNRARAEYFFFSSRRRHTRSDRDWSSDVCSSD